jgi:hypothetical protein
MTSKRCCPGPSPPIGFAKGIPELRGRARSSTQTNRPMATSMRARSRFRDSKSWCMTLSVEHRIKLRAAVPSYPCRRSSASIPCWTVFSLGASLEKPNYAFDDGAVSGSGEESRASHHNRFVGSEEFARSRKTLAR